MGSRQTKHLQKDRNYTMEDGLREATMVRGNRLNALMRHNSSSQQERRSNDTICSSIGRSRSRDSTYRQNYNKSTRRSLRPELNTPQDYDELVLKKSVQDSMEQDFEHLLNHVEIQNQRYPIWNISEEQSNFQAENYYIRRTDMHINLMMTPESTLNCAFIGILNMHNNMSIISPKRYFRRDDTTYETKLYFNGCWRTVEVSCRKCLWNAITYNALQTLYEDRPQEQYLFRILGWIPEKIQLQRSIFYHYLKQAHEQRIAIMGCTINYDYHFTILAFQIYDARKYIICRSGGIDDIGQEIEADIPLYLRQYENKDKNIVVFDWSTVYKNIVINVGWNPHLYRYNEVVHAEYLNELSNEVRNSNFYISNISMYYDPQYVIQIMDPSQSVQLRVLLERHTKDTNNECKIACRLYRSGKTVYVKEPIRPVNYCFYNNTVSCIFILTGNVKNEKYNLVVRREAIRDVRFTYTIRLFSDYKFRIHEMKSDYKFRLKRSGQYRQAGESVYSSKLLNNPLYLIKLKETIRMEIMLETDRLDLKLMNILYRMQSSQANPLEQICINYGRFINSLQAEGPHQGISYSGMTLQPGTYLYIPLVESVNEPENYRFTINYDGYKETVLSVSEVKRLQFDYHLTWDIECKNRISIPLHQDNFAPTELFLNCGCFHIFQVKTDMTFQCFVEPKHNLEYVEENEEVNITGVNLIVVAFGYYQGAMAGKIIYSSGFTRTLIGVLSPCFYVPSQQIKYICLGAVTDTQSLEMVLHLSSDEDVNLEPVGALTQMH